MARSPRKYTDEQLAKAVARSQSMREVLIALGIAPRGGNYETVWRRIDQVGLEAAHLRRRYMKGRRVYSCSDQEIAEALADSRSMAQVLAKLRIRPGRNQSVLKTRIEGLGLDTSHLLGQGWSRGMKRAPVPAVPLEKLLTVGRPTKSHSLRIRLIREGVKEAKCEICGLDAWNGRPIPLELDHINGIRTDNRLINVRIVCPNCHAQTDTYRGRNVGTARPSILR